MQAGVWEISAPDQRPCTDTGAGGRVRATGAGRGRAAASTHRAWPAPAHARASTELRLSEPPRRFPLWPLLATLGVQTLATAAAYSLPAVAPVVAPDLGIPPSWIGFFVSIVYGVGILSALGSPRLIHERGATRVSQAVLVATLAMLAVAASGSVWTVALGAALMGLAYGATAPAATHMLVPLTPPERMNMVISLRQIGVPLGGVVAGLVMPRLTHVLGWQTALLVQIVPCLLLLLALEAVRRRWDGRSAEHGRSAPAGAAKAGPQGSAREPGPARHRLRPAAMMRESVPLRRLLLAVFVFSGLQLCFVAFMTTHMTTAVGLDLVRAGQMLATYQVSGVLTRPIWGWMADNLLPARRLLAIQSVLMCAAAVTAGQLAPGSPAALVMAVAVIGGMSASGYTGIAYGELARLGGARRTETTGLGSAFMFAGVLVLPTLMSLAVLRFGGFEAAYTAIGLLALCGGALLVLPQRRARAV